MSLLTSYLFTSPFKISKRFLLQKGNSDLYTYGETPLTTLDLIARRCHLSAKDTVIELGCGRGRTCFWLNQFIDCSVIGVDEIPTFIQKAQAIKNQFHLSGVSFRLEDLFHTNLSEATVIYLYGICYSNEQIDVLIERFSQLSPGTKIITVSYALREYHPEAPFQLIDRFPASFTWGKTDVYCQIKSS